jgi:hypothetical protein
MLRKSVTGPRSTILNFLPRVALSSGHLLGVVFVPEVRHVVDVSADDEEVAGLGFADPEARIDVLERGVAKCFECSCEGLAPEATGPLEAVEGLHEAEDLARFRTGEAVRCTHVDRARDVSEEEEGEKILGPDPKARGQKPKPADAKKK